MPLGSLPSGREGYEPEDAPLLVSGSAQSDGPLMLAPEQGDLSDHIEGVDNPRTPPVVHEHLECVVGDGLSPLVVTLKQQGAGQPEVARGPGAPVPQGFGGG